MDNYTALRQVYADLGWRIGAAAREGDAEAYRVFKRLWAAIHPALQLHERRTAVAVSASTDIATSYGALPGVGEPGPEPRGPEGP
jgi:hypothetical protein